MAQAERYSITRRQLVAASTAMIPLTAAPAFAGEADPIFALIASHVRAYGNVVALLAAQDAADAAARAANKATRPALAARLSALCDAEGPLGLVEMQATERLITTTAATLPGAAAALSYVRTLFERDNYPLVEEEGYRALLFSTECAICRALGQPARRMG